MTTISRRKFLAYSSLGAAAVAYPAIGKGPIKIKMTQAGVPDGSGMFLYVAKNKGYYKDRGIDIEIGRGTGSLAAAQNVASKNFDFGLAAGSAAFLQSAKGTPLVQLGVAQWDSTMGVLVREDSNIKTPKELEGKTLGSTVTSGEYPFLPLWAEKSGLDLAKVKLLQLDYQVRNRGLLTKEVDAISAFAGSSIPSIAVQGVGTRFFSYSAAGIVLYGLSLLTRPEILKNEKELCKNMTEAMLDGLAYSIKNPEDALNAFAEEVPEVRMSKTGLKQTEIGFGIYTVMSLGAPEIEKGIGWQDPQSLRDQADLVMKYAADPGEKLPPIDELYTNEFVATNKLSSAELSKARDYFKQYDKYMF